MNSYKGTNLVQTLVHQFGHSLGLSHSDMRSAIMSPFFKVALFKKVSPEPVFIYSMQAWDRDLHLDRDDVLAIQTLYGERTGGGALGSMGAQGEAEKHNLLVTFSPQNHHRQSLYGIFAPIPRWTPSSRRPTTTPSCSRGTR